jgi:predicted nucleic acid-binding protein
VSLVYADASALVKLLREERESAALRAFLDGVDLISSELVLAEIPRAVRRAAAGDPSLVLDPMLERAAELIEALALRPLDTALLLSAGALAESALRTLDAIVTYDERQAAVARMAGLRTISPGR